ncbi:MAG: hypothetical protein HY301_06035, partial [Verrucomicrobia bacterium]|nr:hypothetical protein [Verrucomicrobiota bacterium]
SWSVNRHAPYTLAFEYDRWQTTELSRAGTATFTGSFQLDAEAHSVELLTTHTQTEKNLPLSVSSPLLRVETK